MISLRTKVKVSARVVISFVIFRCHNVFKTHVNTCQVNIPLIGLNKLRGVKDCY